MYSERNRRAANGRANDEFLRRMIGGELIGTVPVMNTAPRPTLPDYSNNRTACDGTARKSDNHMNGDCPTHVHAPALSMVYAPRQCWQNLLDPTVGLEKGTIFAELVLPLEVVRKSTGMEGKNRMSK